ncbi:hypothetical protein Tdes44962_MAKER01637 [Teratosphaeria destructans]|uniref:Uncharacterized protein n=1 Tax=Teratosphaeria destructans TaxID=418781 RepID=A0A9W7SXX2_9PEZI|nr:hypothetical protein Tdes44962_MAKER01637 [Teratosphaeria destructans]
MPFDWFRQVWARFWSPSRNRTHPSWPDVGQQAQSVQYRPSPVIEGRRDARKNSSRGSKSPSKQGKNRVDPQSGRITKWRGSCSDFTRLATRVIQRHTDLKLLMQQEAEITRRWNMLQQTIDWSKMRYDRQDPSSGDHARSSRSNLLKVIEAQKQEQARLDGEKSINAARSGVHDAAQEEDDLFAAWPWALEHCQGKTDCLFTQALQESFQNARDYKELVRGEEARLADYEASLERLTREDTSIVSSPGRAEAMAAIDQIREKIDQSKRARQCRLELRDAYRQEFYDLLQQALMQERQDLPPPRRVQSVPDRAAPASQGLLPAVPPLTDKMVRVYNGGTNATNNKRKAHDEFLLDSTEELVKAFRKDPRITRADFDRRRVEDRRKTIQELRSTQEKFMRKRDEALRAGAQPLALHEVVESDVPEFGGSHPSDGWTGSSWCPETRKLREKYITYIATPKVMQWMNAWEGFPNEETEADDVPRGRGWRGSDMAEMARLRRERDMAEDMRDVVQPWDSYSSHEFHDWKRQRIDDWRRTYGSDV